MVLKTYDIYTFFISENNARNVATLSSPDAPTPFPANTITHKIYKQMKYIRLILLYIDLTVT